MEEILSENLEHHDNMFAIRPDVPEIVNQTHDMEVAIWIFFLTLFQQFDFIDRRFCVMGGALDDFKGHKSIGGAGRMEEIFLETDSKPV